MKPRTLSVHRISEEQLRRLMHVVQGICLHENGYFVIAEDIDWLIVLHVLFEQAIIRRGQRPPYRAFVSWMNTHVTLYHPAPKANRLSWMARRLADARHPWESLHAPQYAVRKWQVLYYHLTQLVTQAILLHQ